MELGALDVGIYIALIILIYFSASIHGTLGKILDELKRRK